MSGGPEFVLDASAVLAYLRKEAGAEEVRKALRKRVAISAVNWAEVLSKLADLGYDPLQADERLRQAGVLGTALEVLPFDEKGARDAAGLRASSRALGLSLAERACLALGSELRLPVLTADKVWRALKSPISIRAIR